LHNLECANPYKTRQINLALDVTEYLQLQLMKSGYTFRTSAEREIVKHIKESHCFLSLNPRDEEVHGMMLGTGMGGIISPGASTPTAYTLPDGAVIKLGAERYTAPEILFHPDLVGLEDRGVHELLFDAAARVDVDLRKTLFANIVLSGGSTCFHGYGDKLLHELKTCVRDQKIKIYAPPERKYSTWIGGSILASLSTFKKMWVSAEEYAEYGPSIVHRKCS
jgi:centractin